MRKGRKRYTQKSVIQAAIPALFLFLLALLGAYYIHTAEWLQPEINELTASYLSLNNNDTTDMLKITNLHKMTDEDGREEKNKANKDFEITGDKKATYQIVLYHMGNYVEDEYVKFSLANEKGQIIEDSLKNRAETPDGGKIIFEGKMKDGKRWNLKMWIDKSYHGGTTNLSYEIRMKNK